MTNDYDMQFTLGTPLFLTLLIISLTHPERLVPPQWKENLDEVLITQK